VLAAKQAALRRAVRTTRWPPRDRGAVRGDRARDGRRMVGQPVQALAAQARRIASGDLQAR